MIATHPLLVSAKEIVFSKMLPGLRLRRRQVGAVPPRNVVVEARWSVLRPLVCHDDCAAQGWVNDESIREALVAGLFDDPMIPHHLRTHRATRVATMVRMMLAGVVFPPPTIGIHAGHLHPVDGNHRLRAHEFLGHELITVEVWPHLLSALQPAIVRIISRAKE